MKFIQVLPFIGAALAAPTADKPIATWLTDISYKGDTWTTPALYECATVDPKFKDGFKSVEIKSLTQCAVFSDAHCKTFVTVIPRSTSSIYYGGDLVKSVQCWGEYHGPTSSP